MAVADLASAVTIGVAIARILWLAASHHLALSSAAARAAALVLLGQGLAFAGQSAGTLQESAMFIDDFFAFTEQAPRMESRPHPVKCKLPGLPDDTALQQANHADNDARPPIEMLDIHGAGLVQQPSARLVTAIREVSARAREQRPAGMLGCGVGNWRIR